MTVVTNGQRSKSKEIMGTKMRQHIMNLVHPSPKIVVIANYQYMNGVKATSTEHVSMESK